MIDFTTHHFSDELVAACLKHRKALVMGTTGHTAEELGRIREAAKTLPIVLAPNFSVGVNTLFWLTRKAAQILGDAFDLEVVEMHHRMKTDSPSGTARRLVEILCEETGVELRQGRAPRPLRRRRRAHARRRSACMPCAAAMWWAITP